MPSFSMCFFNALRAGSIWFEATSILAAVTIRPTLSGPATGWRGASGPRASPCLDRARHPPPLANRLGLTLDVREQARMILALQALLDQRAEDHLEAHGQLASRRHGARQGPRPIQDALRQHEEN